MRKTKNDKGSPFLRKSVNFHECDFLDVRTFQFRSHHFDVIMICLADTKTSMIYFLSLIHFSLPLLPHVLLKCNIELISLIIYLNFELQKQKLTGLLIMSNNQSGRHLLFPAQAEMRRFCDPRILPVGQLKSNCYYASR